MLKFAHLVMVLLTLNAFSQSTINKFLLYKDTGYVIYTEPHFKGLFISSTDTTLETSLQDNTTLNYFFTYNEEFKKFIVNNDTIPNFIKNNKDISIYNYGRLDQISINYFKAVVTIRIPIEHFEYLKPSGNKKQLYYLQNTITKKKTYLQQFIKGYMNTLECIEFCLIE